MPKPSIAFVVPALNEEPNVRAAVESCLRSAQTRGLPCAVYVFDDGSTDATGAVADSLAKEDARVKAIHNTRTMGLGYNYFAGVDRASEDYVMMVPGDAEILEEAIGGLLSQAGKADLVIPYMISSAARPLSRRIVSRAFVVFLNVLFGLKIRYYNGPCLLKTALVRQVKLRTSGFAYMAAILVILLKGGHSHLEVAIPLQYRQAGRSKAVNLRNIASVLKTLAALWSETRRHAVSQ